MTLDERDWVTPVLMPLRSGDHKPTEKQAKELAGGVGWHDNQEWIPPVSTAPSRGRSPEPVTPCERTPIVYPENKKRQTKIPLEMNWSTIDVVAHDEPGWWSYRDRRCKPVCRHTRDQCPTNPRPQESARKVVRQWVPIPDPEPADTLPGDIGINAMSFDEKPWLDTMPIEDFAMVGWTQLANATGADDNGKNVAGTLQPGEYWREQDRKHRKASAAPRPATEEPWRSVRFAAIDGTPLDLDSLELTTSGPQPAEDSLTLWLRNRRLCKNCFRHFLMPDDEVRANTRYCSERCRNRSEYASRHGQVGTVRRGVELSSFAVDGKRVGIDTDDWGSPGC